MPFFLASLGFAIPTVPPTAQGAVSAPPPLVRTPAQVEALITQAGKTPPDWWNSVALTYPPTLDLTWSAPPKPWNPQRNLGQYLWDIINPNPAKWREGTRLMHHVLSLQKKDDQAKLARTTESLAHMYYSLWRDWARAAFWYRKAEQMGEHEPDYYSLELAECYWKLGSRDMCIKTLNELEEDDTWNGGLIKLWADLGELDKALQFAAKKAQNDIPDIAYRAAGDACRLAGKLDQAVMYYEKVLATPKTWNGWQRSQERARASLEAVKLFDQANPKQVADGAYTATTVAYAGPLTIQVNVKSGRIESVKVTQHKEKQFYTAISDTTAQIVRRQQLQGIDMTTGATITAEAIVNATAKALAKGRR